MPVQSQIDPSAYGSATDRADLGGTATKVLKGVEDEIITRKKLRLSESEEDRALRKEERDIQKEKDAKKDAIYKREEDFYVANDIPDAGLGYEAGLEKSFSDIKGKMGKIAGKGSNATEEEKAMLRKYTAQIQKVSAGQNHLKQVVADYGAEMDSKGDISRSTPKIIAAILKDLHNGGGKFEPVVGEDGTVRLKGKTSPSEEFPEGQDVDFSYDQLSSIKFSPRFDLSSRLNADREQIGDVVSEVGDTTYTNTPELIESRLEEVAASTLSHHPTLLEIGAEMGFDDDYRKAHPKTYKQDIKDAYKKQLYAGIDRSKLEDEQQRQYSGGSNKDVPRIPVAHIQDAYDAVIRGDKPITSLIGLPGVRDIFEQDVKDANNNVIGTQWLLELDDKDRDNIVIRESGSNLWNFDAIQNNLNLTGTTEPKASAANQYDDLDEIVGRNQKTNSTKPIGSL